MTHRCYTALLIFSWLNLPAQNVGIGTTTPVAKLEVAGEVRIASDTNALPPPGTMRWNAAANDFQGYNGKGWVSLTGGKSGWGNQQNFAYPSAAANVRLTEYVGNLGKGFGSAISIFEDKVLAGAPNDITDASPLSVAAGSARLLQTNNTGGINTLLSAQLYGAENYSYIAESVALNQNTMLLGASRLAQGANAQQGGVLVYSYTSSSTSPAIETTLKASDGNANDLFGKAVYLQGNYIVVGAPGKETGSIVKGKVYVFTKSGGNYSQMTTIVAAEGATGDEFGAALSASGMQLAIGAPGATVNGTSNAGKVYIYQRNISAYNLLATIAPPNPLPYESFGTSIHLKNDTLLVGATQKPSLAGQGNGVAYLYIRKAGAWVLEATLAADDGQKGDQFGTSVYLHNGEIVVGAPKAKVIGNAGQGKAYVYTKEGAQWAQRAGFTNHNGQPGDNFGASAGITPHGIVVGAPNASISGHTGNGRVYFFKN